MDKNKLYLQAKATVITPENIEKELFADKHMNDMPKNHDDKKRKKRMMRTSYAENFINQPDILLIRSVLLTTGIQGNLNDDIFLNEECVPKLDTIMLKPFNMEHNPKNIIGVMADAFLLDKDNNEIDEDGDLPLSLNIGNLAVIWKFACASEVERLLKEEFYVSNEIWFTKWDYALGTKIIARNEETSPILDPHLRVRGGDGIFEGQLVKRVIRNITFGGIGAVKHPANPNSIILEIAGNTVDKVKNTTDQAQIAAEISKLPDDIIKVKENYELFLEIFKNIYDEKTQKRHEIANYKDILAKYMIGDLSFCVENSKDIKKQEEPMADIAVVKVDVDAKNLEEVKNAMAGLEKSLSEMTSEANTLKVEVSKLQKDIETLTKERDSLKSELGKIAHEKKVADRKSKLSALSLDEARITRELKKTDSFDDKTFDEHVEDIRSLINSIKPVATEPVDEGTDPEALDEVQLEATTAAKVLDSVPTKKLDRSEREKVLGSALLKILDLKEK